MFSLHTLSKFLKKIRSATGFLKQVLYEERVCREMDEKDRVAIGRWLFIACNPRKGVDHVKRGM